MVEDINPYIIDILTVSWATTYISDNELGMTGYVMFRNVRIVRRVGGIILCYEIKLEREAKCEEAAWCNIFTRNSTLTIGLVYRSPNISIEDNERVQIAIKEVSKRDCIIMGDSHHGPIKWKSLQNTGSEDQVFFI